MPRLALLSAFGLALCARTLLAQSPYIGRFDLYSGFSDFNTPGLNNINQIGVHLQAGVNTNRWSTLGVDYSNQSGSTHLTPTLATPLLRAQLAAELPAGYALNLPVGVTVQTLTAGGQFVFRNLHIVTLSLRPVIAAFRINGTPHPNDPINTLVAAQLAPSGHLTDWYPGYGAGGGAEFPLFRHLGALFQFDAVWNHPFPSIIANGHVSYRYSAGPAFHFGPNLLHATHR